MNYSPSSRDAIDEHCREVIRSCLNIVEQHGDTYDRNRVKREDREFTD